MKDLSVQFQKFEAIKAALIEARHFDQINFEARKFMFLVADATREVNTGMEKEVEQGQYDDFYLLPSFMCYLRDNFSIQPGKRCLQCGNVHN